MFTRQEANIDVAAMKLTKKNSRRVYDGKQEEFLEFCYHIFGHEENCETINEKKVYVFMLYQCYRQKKGKGDKWSTGYCFRISDYDEVMNRVSNNCDEVIKDLLDYDM